MGYSCQDGAPEGCAFRRIMLECTMFWKWMVRSCFADRAGGHAAGPVGAEHDSEEDIK